MMNQPNRIRNKNIDCSYMYEMQHEFENCKIHMTIIIVQTKQRDSLTSCSTSAAHRWQFVLVTEMFSTSCQMIVFCLFKDLWLYILIIWIPLGDLKISLIHLIYTILDCLLLDLYIIPCFVPAVQSLACTPFSWYPWISSHNQNQLLSRNVKFFHQSCTVWRNN